MMADEFLTLRARARAETRVQDSRFVATAVPAAGGDEAMEVVAELRKKYHDATHNCFAYRVTPEQVRTNDDGEPSGTAGRVILAEIQKAGLTRTLVVVTRYFGGTKLGVGGLKRAYGAAAATVIDCAEKVAVVMTETLTCTVPYSLVGPVMQVISRHGATVRRSLFDEAAHITLEVRSSVSEALRGAIRDATSGAARFTPGS